MLTRRRNEMKTNKIFLVAILMMIATMGMVNAQESNNPVLKLSLSTYDPIPAEPGKLVDVWINVQNIGDTDAKNIVLEFIDSPAFTIVSEEDRTINVPVLGAYKDYTIKYKIKVSENVADGPNNLMIKYTIGNINSIVSTAKIPIDVKSAETAVSINEISLNPSPVEAGGETKLSFDVANLAKSSSIRNVDVTVQITTVVSGTTLVDLPFVTVNSGNQKSIDRIGPGQNGQFIFDLAVYPEAESKIYKLPVTVSYYDDTGRQYTKTILVGVEVNAKPDLLVTLESSDINSKVNTGNVLFNIINRGTSNVKLMTLTLKTSDQYEILSPSNQLYLGNIDSDDFETARFNVKSNGNNELNFDIELKYKDSLNNEFTEIHTVKYAVKEPEQQSKSSFSWILIILVIVVVGVIWYRRRNKKKNNN
jgi:hypothetical protein